MVVSMMIDSKMFQQKPKQIEVAGVNNRLMKSPKQVNVQGLATATAEGKSFTPAYFESKNGTIKRNRDYWKSQQVVCLDFDNEIVRIVNGKKVKQKHVTMTIDQALHDDFILNNAAFIYTSFSNKVDHPKFRVVFILDKPVNDYIKMANIIKSLLEKYPTADKSCSDGTRLFYGGKKLYKINDTNVLRLDNLSRGSCVAHNVLRCTTRVMSNTKPPLIELGSHIDLITNKDAEGLKKRLKPITSTFDSMLLVGNYIKQQDIRAFIGVSEYGSFNDIFHDEQEPSASIYINSKNKQQIYKCHSDSSEWKGTIIDIVMRLQDCDMIQARDFLMRVYNIKSEVSEQKKYLRELLDEYKHIFINDELLKQVYPYIYKVLGRYTKDIYIVLDLAKEFITGNKDEMRMMFYHTTRTLSKLFMTSHRSAVNRMNLFALVDIVKKMTDNDIKKGAKKVIRTNQKEKHFKNRNDLYEVEHYQKNFLRDLEEQCKYLSETGFTMRGLTYEGLYRNYGVEVAKKVFVQVEPGTMFTQLSQEVISQINNITLTLIEAKGWTTEKEVLEECNLYFKGQGQYKKDKFKQSINEMVDAYDLEIIQLNKKIRKVMGISEEILKGYPRIIRKSN